MKVFILIGILDEESEVFLGVYSSKDAAEKAGESFLGTDTRWYSVRFLIQERDLDGEAFIGD